MRKRMPVIAPALVAGLLLLGGYRLAAHPASVTPPPAPRPATASATAASPALLAAAGAERPAAAGDTAERAAVAGAAVLAGLPVAATFTPTFTPTATITPAATATPAPSATARPPATATPTATAVPAFVPPDRIVAPAIGLDAKVVTVGWHEVVASDGSKHTEWDVASYAAGWHKNSAKPGQAGNIVLSGHNNIEGEVFRNLEKFRQGDQITLYAGDRTFTYVVSDSFTLLDKGVPYAQRVKNAQWIGPFPDQRLTLVSCWPPTNNTHRIFIIAKPGE